LQRTGVQIYKKSQTFSMKQPAKLPNYRINIASP